MRAAVPSYMRDLEQAPPGHRFGIYFAGWTEGWRLADKQKQQALAGIRLGTGDHARLDALIARQQEQAGKLGDALFSIVAKSTAPFVTGMGYEHPLENGFAFLNPYGLPYLPGASIKGVLRDAARDVGIEDAVADRLFGSSNAEDDARRGALNFWDAFPQGKLMVEIMTPHHSGYLQNGGTPHDSEKPNPIPFLAVAPGARFHFFVQQIGDVGDCDWREVLAQCFQHAFDWLGFGAKTAVGYGAMSEDPAEVERRKRAEAARKRAEEKARRQAEEERKAREAEARRQAELAAMPAHQRALELAKEELERLIPCMRSGGDYGPLRHVVKELIANAQGWDATARREVADWLEQSLTALKNGWRHPDLNAKKRKQWEKKQRDALEKLRHD
ncbi:MAG: type III-B CRISPR module RAMP protein Cmr6 [Zetaproteobacteria bacterium]|nr:MAG: type III-B CRISPR module RAMP protein Cmr6 [Zetaproteobacteria bacterium]